MNASEQLLAGAKVLDVSLHSEQANQLHSFLLLIQKWNQTYNLVGASDTETLLTKHILDSLAVAPFINQDPILDVGSGGGLPGIPLAIARPDLSFTLLDANGKKTRFMRQAMIELKLSNVEVVQERLENYVSQPLANIVLARAFAPLEQALSQLAEQCAPKNGQVIIMLGTKPEPLPAMPNLKNIASHEIVVPGLDSQRHLCVATKT